MLFSFIVYLTVVTTNGFIVESVSYETEESSFQIALDCCNDFADISILDTEDNPDYRIVSAECHPVR